MKKIGLWGMVFPIGLAALMCSCALGVQKASAGVNVNWKLFMERHDLVWTQAPKAWHDEPFLGNGMLGSMLHQQDDHTFRISLGRAVVEDHKTEGPPFITLSRLPNGYFTLKTAGKITGFEGRLDLYIAEMRVQSRTGKGTIDLIGLVHRDDMVIAYDLKPSAGESALQLDFVPLKSIAPTPASEADCHQFGMISPEIEKGL